MASPLHGSSRDPTRREDFPALPPRLRRGDTLGHYRIIVEIAQGATATVFRARSLLVNRDVALKVLSSDLALLPKATARFRREAQLARRVEGAGIVPVYDVGKARQYLYYSMELETGETAQALKPEERAWVGETFYRRVAMAFSGVARALTRIHEAGIVHRDVKPDNLLLGWKGQILVSDFGSALEACDGERDSALWGTVRYLSPEQLRPDADPLDPRVDIYALGMTLYEVLTGASAFPRCSTEELVRLKLDRCPPPPRHVDPKLPLGLDSIIRQAMHEDPSFRYAAADELADDLERFATYRRGHRR